MNRYKTPMKLFQEIKKKPAMESSQSLFDLLNEIQKELCLIAFKEAIHLPKSLHVFLSDFDRIDDIWWRGRIFDSIKYNNYILTDESKSLFKSET